MTAKRGHNTHRDRLSDIKGVPDREHDIAHVKHVAAPEFNRRKIVSIDLKKSEVCFRIRADELC